MKQVYYYSKSIIRLSLSKTNRILKYISTNWDQILIILFISSIVSVILNGFSFDDIKNNCLIAFYIIIISFLLFFIINIFNSRLELKRKLNISSFKEFLIDDPTINVSNSNFISPFFYIFIQNKSNYIINDLKLKVINISSTNNPDFHSQINGLFIRSNFNETRPNETHSFESISFSDSNGVYINTMETTSIYLDHGIYHLELQLFYNYCWKIFSNTKFTVIIDYSESKPNIYIPTL